MTMADYMRKCHGYGQRQLSQWHHTRAIAFTMYRVMGGKDSATKFMPLEDDQKQVNKEDVEAVRANFQKIKDFYNGRISRS